MDTSASACATLFQINVPFTLSESV
ncbi:unnamed protein product [Victoria cruziana]